MEEKNNAGSHKLQMMNRKECFLTGVRDVISFDTETILLETDLGMLTIRGSNLHIRRLTLEKKETDIEGNINSLVYSSSVGAKNKTSLLGKLFG